jgi:hypothetical protein
MIFNPILISSVDQFGGGTYSAEPFGQGIQITPDQILTRTGEFLPIFFQIKSPWCICLDLRNYSFPDDILENELVINLTLFTFSHTYLKDQNHPVLIILCDSHLSPAGYFLLIGDKLNSYLRGQGYDGVKLLLLNGKVRENGRDGDEYYSVQIEKEDEEVEILRNIHSLFRNDPMVNAYMVILANSRERSLALLVKIKDLESEFAREQPAVYTRILQIKDLILQRNILLLDNQVSNFRQNNYSTYQETLKKEAKMIVNWYKEEDLKIKKWYFKEYEVLPLWYKRFGHALKWMMRKRNPDLDTQKHQESGEILRRD